MPTDAFNISSAEEAEALQAGFREFRMGRGRADRIPAGFLAEILPYAPVGVAQGQLFWAMVDLEFTHMFMELDIDTSVTVWNEHLSRGRPHAHAFPLLNPEALNAKMERLDSLTSFTLRCRAFWDKYIGILFLLYDPTNYEEFSQSSSKLRSIKRHAPNWPSLSRRLQQCLDDHTIETIPASAGLQLTMPAADKISTPPASSFPDNLLKLIDGLNRIRTSEAHGTGTLRKWVLAQLSPGHSKETWLIVNFNASVYFMDALRDTLCELARSRKALSSG